MAFEHTREQVGNRMLVILGREIADAQAVAARRA